MSQATRIWKHLRRTGRIDPMTALRRFGCFRLAARIAELRSAHPGRIRTVLQHNGSAHYAQYRLERRP